MTRQAQFYNTVAHIETQLSATYLLKILQDLEILLGRRRFLPWGPRIIDIDILIYGNEKRQTRQLTLPHPQIWERPYVTQQLLEFDSTLIKKVLHFSSK